MNHILTINETNSLIHQNLMPEHFIQQNRAQCFLMSFILLKLYFPDEKNEQLPLKRLRPEKPKREIPDYDYDDYTQLAQASLNGGEAQPNTFSKRIFAENYDHDHFRLVSQKAFERSDSFEVSTTHNQILKNKLLIVYGTPYINIQIEI